MTVYFFGPYYTEKVVEERGLPSPVVPARNRMYRLAKAMMAAGEKVVVVSGGVALRMPFTRPLYSSRIEESDRGVKVLTLPCFLMPIFGYLLEALFLFFFSLSLVVGRRFEDRVVFYNFMPSYLPSIILLKYFGRLKVYCDLEDVSVPQISDWRADSETRPVQQLVYGLAMRIVIHLSQGVIIPTARFEEVIPNNKRRILVTGCLDAGELGQCGAPVLEGDAVKVLFVGKYEHEHGFDLVTQALDLLGREGGAVNKFEFMFCGTRSLPSELSRLMKDYSVLNIRFLGFVTKEDYAAILGETDVCLALQRSSGRHSRYKTPSKAYEFIGAGKVVFFTDVGDLAELDGRCGYMLKDENPAELARLLNEVAYSKEAARAVSKGAEIFARENYSGKVVGGRLLEFLRA